MNKEEKIFVAGHKGMVGSSICKKLNESGYKNILTISKKDIDLTDKDAVDKWFKNNIPDIVILAAAKVGGITANNNSPYEFLIENINIQNNVIESAWKYKSKRLLFLGSSCIYPKYAEQPIKEDYLMKGELESTNESYALAKILGIRLCYSLRIEYGFDAISLMPTNLYGPGDNYHPLNSHVLPSFIKRFSHAKDNNLKEVICWGTGSPFREFLHVSDLAEACIFVLNNWYPNSKDAPKLENGNLLTYLNVGTGLDIRIKDLAKKIADIIDFKGKIIWDITKPDGTPKKQLDISRISKLGWKPSIDFEDGLRETISNYLKITQNH